MLSAKCQQLRLQFLDRETLGQGSSWTEKFLDWEGYFGQNIFSPMPKCSFAIYFDPT